MSSTLEKIQDPVEKAFWEGTSRGQLLVRHCESCSKPHWQPRAICPHCGHQKTVFKAASGLGTIYSLTRLHAKGAPVRTLAYVRLDEGVTMLSNITGNGHEDAAIGQRVQVAFETDAGGLQLPFFRLA